jgi:acetyl esterase/lipase
MMLTRLTFRRAFATLLLSSVSLSALAQSSPVEEAPEEAPVVFRERHTECACYYEVVGEKAPVVEKGVEFARVGGTPLLLDLYLPPVAAKDDTQRFPLVVWVHGGAWRRGSRDSIPLTALVQRGVAVASVDYRLSPVAKFPAQVHDIKAAIRFLRANADKYQLNRQRFAVAGASAGGHLAATVGVSSEIGELEGTVGEHLGVRSNVAAIVDFYGPTNFMTILQQSTPHGLSVRVPALELLIGGRPEEHPKLAHLGSAVEHVDATDPPLLLIHGDQDPQVPINQSHELHGRYKASGLPVMFEVIHGGAHGGAEFYDEKRIDLVHKFLMKHWNAALPTSEKKQP